MARGGFPKWKTLVSCDKSSFAPTLQIFTQPNAAVSQHAMWVNMLNTQMQLRAKIIVRETMVPPDVC